MPTATLKLTKRPPVTLKERKWAHLYVQLGNATEAAMRAYQCKNRNSAHVIGSENLQKLTLSELMEDAGLTDRHLVVSLKDITEATRPIPVRINNAGSDSTGLSFVEVPDWHARLRAIELVLKLKGKLPAQNNQPNPYFQNMIEDMKRELGIDQESLSRLSNDKLSTIELE